MANTTSSDPSTSTFEAAVLQDLIKVAGLPPTRGTHRDPVLGFKLLGLGVRDAALTYRATQHPPSLSREVGVSQQCRRPGRVPCLAACKLDALCPEGAAAMTHQRRR